MALRCLTLHLLALLVLVPRGSLQPPGDGQEGVPAEFQHLQDVEDHIAQAEWRPGDRRSAAGQLEQLGRADQPLNLQSRLQTAREVLETSQPEVDRSLPSFEPADKNVILMLQYDEAVVASGYALLGKATPRPKFLLQWREDHFQLKAPKEVTSVTITARTKLVVVGHGVVENGRITLGGMSAGELAQAIGTLSKRGKGIHMDKSTKFLQEVSLVSCDVGSGAEGKGFVKELLVQMRNIGLKVGYVSARTITTYVLPDGTKRTAESVDSEFWSKGDPSHKRKFHLEEDGTLREREYTPKELHMERKAPLEGYRVQHPYQKILSWKDGAKYYKIEDTLVENIIEAITNKIFSELPGPNLRDTEMQKLLIHTTDGRTHLYPVRKITSLKGLEDNIKEIIQRTLDIRSTTKAQDVDRTLNREFRYFRFKDFVYKMNLFNFYVKLHGTTSNVPLDQSLNKLDYDSMANMKEKEHFVEMAKNWVQGDHDAISNNVNVYDGMAVIATHISEAVRNPRVFITNRLMWDVTSSWLDFRRNCPMAGGGTWPKKELIGLDHTATDNVRDRTLATMKLWLTRKYRNTYTTMNVNADAKPLPKEGAEKLQEVLTELPLQDTAIDYSCRPQIGPLSDTQLSKLQGFEEAVRGKSLQPQLLLKSAEDQQRVQGKIRQVMKDQSSVDRSDYQKINSLEKYNDGLKL
ncbi:uncharacterized protein [Ambystoma mexicanum]|uniref:uncharacterized protein n=1 Tax=Ambystoma mexicanum TaxID=8296 RepID=UPI0037E8A676